MAIDSPGQEAALRDLVEAAGQSLSTAQGTLGAELDVSSGLVMASAELEVKAAVRSDDKGRLAVQPISAQDIRRGSIDPGLLSTVRVSFVATINDAVQTTASKNVPIRPVEDVIKDFRSRPDIANLDRILGSLTVDATYVPGKKRWLVTARDSKARLVREVILPDEP